jgi:hypothetical protein
MWSGPRNLSTAMMVSFAQRHDCAVVDEPFYAAYLQETGLKHPLYQEIINDGVIDYQAVVDYCIGEVPDEKQVFYQKHMTHHMIPEFDREWIAKVTNVFLIRDPLRVIASYNIKRENPSLADIGVVEQLEIFDLVCEMTGDIPIVVDSADILANPELMLKKLCTSIGLEFDPQMLSWAAGPKLFDGIWAKHWYGSVWESTGFGKPSNNTPFIPPSLTDLAQEAVEHFVKIKAHALSPH